jgi:hypothetical protein
MRGLITPPLPAGNCSVLAGYHIRFEKSRAMPNAEDGGNVRVTTRQQLTGFWTLHGYAETCSSDAGFCCWKDFGRPGTLL